MQRTCQARLKSKGGLKCGNEGATPRFTKALRDMGRNDAQPKFICKEHDRRFPAVDAFTGEPAKNLRGVKSFDVRPDGALVPLKGGDQYGAYQARRARG
jgi:hypothetical protein